MSKAISILKIKDFIEMLRKCFTSLKKAISEELVEDLDESFCQLQCCIEKIVVKSEYKMFLDLTDKIVDDLINRYLESLNISLIDLISYEDIKEIEENLYLSEDIEGKLECLAEGLVCCTMSYVKVEKVITSYNLDAILLGCIESIIAFILYENIERIYKDYVGGMFPNNISQKYCNQYLKFFLELHAIISNDREDWIENGLELIESFMKINLYRLDRNMLQKDNYKKKQEKIEKVKCLKQEGVKVTDIAKQMGVCRKTVYNYLKL